MANIEEKVEKLLKDEIEKNGYDLYDVEYAIRLEDAKFIEVELIK